MIDTSEIGMKRIARAQKERLDILTHLTTTQIFDPKNPEHIVLIKKYNDDFELMQNQMYLFNGMSLCLWFWAGSFVTHFFLPIPDISSYLLLLGLTGTVLAHFCTTDFSNHLTELKTVYNWCLKHKDDQGHYEYDGVTCNTEKLNHLEIQRMLSLLAPSCSVEFMQVWSKETKEAETNTGFLEIVADASQKAWSTFFPKPKSTTPTPSEKLKSLKLEIEANSLKVNAFDGLKIALHYFATNPTFRDIIQSKFPVLAIISSAKDALSKGHALCI